MGLGTTLMQVTFLSIVANFYPSNKAWLIGILEACAGAGMMLGPLMGTALYALGGYNFMLTTCGVVFLILGFFV
jgi:MFS family permease